MTDFSILRKEKISIQSSYLLFSSNLCFTIYLLIQDFGIVLLSYHLYYVFSLFDISFCLHIEGYTTCLRWLQQQVFMTVQQFWGQAVTSFLKLVAQVLQLPSSPNKPFEVWWAQKERGASFWVIFFLLNSLSKLKHALSFCAHHTLQRLM